MFSLSNTNNNMLARINWMVIVTVRVHGKGRSQNVLGPAKARHDVLHL